MKPKEVRQALESLPPESRLRFSAYYLDRLLREAALHPIPRAQLKHLPLMREASEILWARTERDERPDAARVDVIAAHIDDHWLPDPRGEGILFVFDAIVYKLANALTMTATVLADPAAITATYVSHFHSLVWESVSLIYEDFARARASEESIVDEVISLLLVHEGRPFSRGIFDAITEWPRGQVSMTYRLGRITGTSEDD